MEQNSSILLAWGAFTRDGGAAAATPTDNDDAPAAADDDSATDVPPPAFKASRRSGGGGEENAENAPANAIVHNVGDDRFETEVVNVMGRAMPKVPAFPKLAPKPGVIRGYVYDTKGRPLKNAVIGVRASLFTGASGKTDAKGYYEITPPLMATEFYKAAYPMDYGDGRAVLGLHPADGEADLDSAKVGTVENFVMMPYGIGDRAGVQDRPHYSGNYYGGSLSLGWYADEDPRFPDATKLPPDGTIEITFTPDGSLVDGSPARPIIIRKLVGRGVNTGLYVHNIPVGGYKMTARLVGGPALNLKEIGPAGRAFGISPENGDRRGRPAPASQHRGPRHGDEARPGQLGLGDDPVGATVTGRAGNRPGKGNLWRGGETGGMNTVWHLRCWAACGRSGAGKPSLASARRSCERPALCSTRTPASSHPCADGSFGPTTLGQRQTRARDTPSRNADSTPFNFGWKRPVACGRTNACPSSPTEKVNLRARRAGARWITIETTQRALPNLR
jgi:hypothetical protein